MDTIKEINLNEAALVTGGTGATEGAATGADAGTAGAPVDPLAGALIGASAGS